jgi:hypothetical protein
MIIPKKFQVEKRDALLIVSGKREATFYRIHGENMEPIESFHIAKPEYTDFEGEFKTRGRGITISSGAVKEIDDESTIKYFLRELKRRFNNIRFNVSNIYLLAPPQTKNKIKEALPNNSRRKIKSMIDGNFSRFHPIQLLERVYAEPAPP